MTVVKFLIPTFYLAIFGVPTVCAMILPLTASHLFLKGAALFFAPLIFSLLYVLTAGLLSRPFAKAIIPGVFPRDLKHQIYGARRLYGAAWTAIYYFTPLYFAFISVPTLRKMLFRLFGYKFSMNFTIYPDVWLRDLTCIKFEDGAYIANKASVGTNMCLLDGTILVDRIKIGKNSMVGHATLLGPGVNFQENIETAVFNIFGIRTRVNSNAKLGSGIGISHGTTIGESADVGHYVYFGTKCILGPNIRVPAGASIPSGTTILTQEECDQFYSSETQNLNSLRQELFTAMGNAPDSLSGLRTKKKQDEPWKSSGSGEN